MLKLPLLVLMILPRELRNSTTLAADLLNGELSSRSETDAQLNKLSTKTLGALLDMPLSAKLMVWFPLLNLKSLMTVTTTSIPAWESLKKSLLLSTRLWTTTTFTSKVPSWSPTWLPLVLPTPTRLTLALRKLLKRLFLFYPEPSHQQSLVLISFLVDKVKKKPLKTLMKWTGSLTLRPHGVSPSLMEEPSNTLALEAGLVTKNV